MHIDEDILFAWGAVARKYKKGSFVFYENDPCRNYYQILKGAIKMCCYNDEGRVFTQGIFSDQESFGEPPLFLNLPYPASAIADQDTILLQISKETLFKLFSEYPFLQMDCIKGFSRRLYDKANLGKNIANPNPEKRLIGFMNYYKMKQGNTKQRVKIPYSRQELADFLGLRVETIIRTIKKMEENHVVEIINRKVHY